MTTKWYYAYQEYATEALCDATVLSWLKLDNEPTEYMMTPVTSDGNGGWVVGEQLSDAEILAVGTGGTYNIHSPLTGETEVGVTGAVVKPS